MLLLFTLQKKSVQNSKCTASSFQHDNYQGIRAHRGYEGLRRVPHIQRYFHQITWMGKTNANTRRNLLFHTELQSSATSSRILSWL